MMKNKIFKILCLTCVFVFCGCNNHSESKDIEKMSIIELNNYYKEINREYENINKKYESLLDVSGLKSKEEIIQLINYVNNEVVKSNVMITNESKSFFHTTSVSSGSGTIIKEDEEYYYVLTNNHVIYTLGSRTSYYIYDYLNNEYSATLLFNDPNYDMALLRFRKSYDLRVTKLAKEDVKEKENIITIGQPRGQRNAITFGEVLYYKQVICDDCKPNESNVKYECVYYNAKTTNGNSGGMLINYNYELVGVVTFGMSDNFGEYIYGAGSPTSKVREFLSNNNFEVGVNDA